MELHFIALNGDATTSSSLSHTLDDGEKARAAAFRGDGIRDRWIAARAHLRGLIGAKLACPPEEVVFAKGEYGKPHVMWPETSLEFSLSHSGDHALIALSETGPVGVDLEPLSRSAELAACTEQFCSPRERALLATLPEEALIRIWCAKEAYLKALGTGFAIAPEGLTVEWDGDWVASIDPAVEGPDLPQFSIHFPSLPGAPDWCAAVALPRGVECPPIPAAGSSSHRFRAGA